MYLFSTQNQENYHWLKAVIKVVNEISQTQFMKNKIIQEFWVWVHDINKHKFIS